MNQELMKSFILLAQSIIDKARRKGFDILLLLGIVGTLAWWILQMETKSNAREIKWETKCDRMSSEWSAALNSANARILECERDKYDLSLRVAVLEYQLGQRKLKR